MIFFLHLFSGRPRGGAYAPPRGRPLNGRYYLLALVAAIFCCAPLHAADYEQKQDGAVLRILRAAKVEDGQVESALGNVKLDLTLTVEGRAPLKVGAGDEQAVKAQVAALDSAPPGLGCKAVGPVSRTTAGDRETWQLTLHLDPRKDGKVELHPAPLEYTEGPDAVPHRVEWNPIPLVITSELASLDPKQELRDITPPEEPPPPPPSWLRWLPWAGVAVALAGLVAGGWQLRRRFTTPARPLTPHEWAARELDRIEALQLPRAGELERYHTLLSDVVRVYLEQRFSLPASHQTTAEFLETMRRSPQLTPAQQGLLRDFLGRCDMAKFARAAPPPAECRAVAAMARGFVQETTPDPQAPNPPESLDRKRTTP
jgi:hypothetical protein